MFKDETFPTLGILQLACAAQRVNGSYVKEGEAVYSEDGKFMYIKTPNKMMMLVTLDPRVWTADPKDAPMPLKVLPEDIALADEIQEFYKRLLFAAIEGESEFQTNLNTILNGETVKANQFGYVACLPSVYARDCVHNNVKKAARKVDTGFLGEVGAHLADLDCEIVEVIKSKNYEGWNICAIIDNKMASWMSQKELSRGPCVIVKAKVKTQGQHWKHGNDETRLNFVKAAQ